jgi:hypothetical protein
MVFAEIIETKEKNEYKFLTGIDIISKNKGERY